MIKSIFTKTNLLLFFITLGSVLWLLPSFCPEGNDREIFRFIGNSIRNGFIPYKDIFDHKPPFIYFIFLVFSPLGKWDVFIPSTIYLLISVFLIKKLISNEFKYLGFIIPLFLIIWLRNPFFYEYGGLTREYTAYLYCIFFYCFHLRKNIGWLAFIAGIVFINQQNEILPLLPFIFYSLIQNKEYSLGNIFKLIFCFIVPFLLISGWLMANNGFTEFIDQAFKFNFQYYTQLKIRNIAYSIVTIFTKYPFLMLGILMLYYQLIWVKNRKLVFTLSLSIFACFYNIFISGRLYGHYFLPLGPILVYTSIVLMHETHQTKLKTNYIIVALLICSFSIIWQNRAFNLNQQIAIAKKQNSTNSQIKNEIQKGLGNIDKIYFINTSAGLYFNTLYEKMPPSKYVYFSIWDEIPMWDKDLKEFKGILNSMKRQRTLVFDFTVNKPFNRAMMNEQLSKLLKINFKKIGRIENNEGQILFNIYSNISAEGHD